MVVPEGVERTLIDAIEADPTLEITVDVERRTLEVPAIGLTVDFPLEDSVRDRFINGLDDIGITLHHVAEIDGYEETRSAWLPTTV